jgi:hypothetical protein
VGEDTTRLSSSKSVPTDIEQLLIYNELHPPFMLRGIYLDRESPKFGLQIFTDAFTTAFPSNTALFHSAKRRGRRRGINIVDADDTKAQLLKGPHGPGDVVGVHLGCQTVLGVIGYLNDFFFRVKGNDWGNGAEDFFAIDLHAGCDVA